MNFLKKISLPLMFFTVASATASTFSYNLNKGWNTLSIPIDLSTNGISTIENKIGTDKLVKIWGKKDSQFVSYTPGAASFLNKLDAFKSGQVYYFNISDDITFSIDGNSYTDKKVTLVDGWNTVGFFDSTINISELVSKIGEDKIIKIWGKKDSQFVSYTPGAASFLNKLDSIEPTKVYYLNLKDISTSLEVDFSVNFVIENRGVVSQNSDSFVLKVKSLSTNTYENDKFYTNDTPPTEILPITITNNKDWGVNIPGVYADQEIQLSRNNGNFFQVDLTGITAGNTKIVTESDNNTSTPGDNNTSLGLPPSPPSVDTVVNPPAVPSI